MKLVILDIADGDLLKGFPITIRIGKNNQFFAVEEGERLPPAPELATAYQEWQNSYRNLGYEPQYQGNVTRWHRIQRVEEQHFSKNEKCRDSAQKLLDIFHQWLNERSFWRVREKIALNINEEDSLRIVIKTQDSLLRRLPWNEWELLETYTKAEIAISVSDSLLNHFRSGKMRILAAFGSNEGINLIEDRKILQDKLPDAEIVYLSDEDKSLTKQSLLDLLCDKEGWDIFFFAGHSMSEKDGTIGRIFINSNPEDSGITIDELKYSLRRAIERGLKLAIFNSCDGLGLAYQLASLKMPNVVVMREPLPDKVAHNFIQNLLKNLKEGEELNLAVRHARERLQDIDDNCPCATWLPVVCQQPQTQEFKYRQLPKFIQIIQEKLTKKKYKLIFGISLAIASAVLIIKLDRINSFNRRFSEGEKIIFLDTNDSGSKKDNSNKQKGVNAFFWENYEEAQTAFKQSLDKYPNDPEARIYWNNSIVGERAKVKIAVVVPAGSNPEVAKEILRGIAIKQEEINKKGGIKVGDLQKYLTIQIVNDDNEEEIAQKVAQKLVEDKEIVAVVGHNSSNSSLEAVKFYERQLVMITSTSTAESLTSDNQDKYIYRMVLKSSILAKYLGEYAKENYNNIIICGDSLAKDKSFVIEFTKTIDEAENDSDITCDLANINNEKKVQDFAKLAMKSKADAIFISPFVKNIDRALMLAKSIDKNKIKLLGNTSLISSITSERGKDTEGIIVVAPWDANNLNENNQKFVSDSKQIWKDIKTTTWRTATTYDALGTIVAAIEKQDDTRDGISLSLANPKFSFQGITGKIAFQPNGDLIVESNSSRGKDAPKPILQQLQCRDSDCSFKTIDKQFNRHSLGEKILFSQLQNPIKQKAVKSFADRKYSEAIEQFTSYLKQNPNDPEARVYLNNAKATLAKGKLRLAIPLPIGSNPDVAAEMLRGIVQAQEEIDKKGGINGKLLELKIFNDDNQGEIAEKLAEEIIKDPSVLAVIGHNASNAAIAASKIYDAYGLVAISPTSFSKALDDSKNGNIFRMMPNIDLFADRLANYIVQTSPQAKVVICYDSDSPDNTPFKNIVRDRLQSQRGKYRYIDLDCQLNKENFNASQKIELLQQQPRALSASDERRDGRLKYRRRPPISPTSRMRAS
jgi:branched-chain amino acid transport system substrate-binding protein